MKAFVLTFALLLCNTALSSEKPSILLLTGEPSDLINWFIDDPVAIGVDTTRMLLRRLDNYDIESKSASFSRITELLTTVDNACVATRIKTSERQNDHIFSLPLNVYPGLRLFYLASKDPLPNELFNDQEQIKSLKSLFLMYPRRKLSVAPGRSLGDYLDNQVKSLPDRNVWSRFGENNYEATKLMLFKDRIDYIIDFPTEIAMNMDRYEPTVELASSAISGSPDYIVGRIACNKTAIGQQFISDVDANLRKIYQSTEFVSAHLNHINKAEHAKFLRDYKVQIGL